MSEAAKYTDRDNSEEGDKRRSVELELGSGANERLGG